MNLFKMLKQRSELHRMKSIDNILKWKPKSQLKVKQVDGRIMPVCVSQYLEGLGIWRRRGV